MVLVFRQSFENLSIQQMRSVDFDKPCSLGSPLSNEFPQFGIHTSGIRIDVLEIRSAVSWPFGPVSVCNNVYFVQIRVKRAPNRRKELGDTEKYLITIKTKNATPRQIYTSWRKVEVSAVIFARKKFHCSSKSYQ